MQHEEIDKLVQNTLNRKKVSFTMGNCSMCGDFGKLTKAIWTDPYTDSEGWGKLCDKCLNRDSTKSTASKYDFRPGRIGTIGFHPVPKPIKKVKKQS